MKISYVHSLCVKHDAISEAIRNEIEWLLEQQHEVTLFCYECSFTHLPYKKVESLSDIAFDRDFQLSECVVFHYGIYYPLFDILPITPIRARQIVVFHNITPKEFVPSSNHSTIDKSFKQLTNIRFSDHVACVSHTNLDVLRCHGIDTPATVLPLAVNAEIYAPSKKKSFVDNVIRIAFIGRFVRSKGPTELIRSLRQFLDLQKGFQIRLDMIGNLGFSDQNLVAETKNEIHKLLLKHESSVSIEIHWNASEALKHEILADADIFVLPTYHEGFCVPIVEALASGCRIISYDNSNVPAVSGGFATLVQTGDIQGITASLTEMASEISSDAWRNADTGSYAQYIRKTQKYVSTFSVWRTKERFINFITLMMNERKKGNL